MTTAPKSEKAIKIIDKQLKELAGIAISAKSSGDTRLGFERLHRWKARTVSLLSENIHPNEGKKLQDKKTPSYMTYGIILDNLLEAVHIYSVFLGSLREELKRYPEYILDVPTSSVEEVMAIKTPQPTSKREPKNTSELFLRLFDSMQLHPKIVEASRKLFEDEHYRDAILRAFIEVNNFVKAKTGLELDGKALMSKAFRIENPVIKLNELKTQSEKDEQEGFMFLFMGAMVGIRNPKAHDNIIQADPLRTLEYLAFASLLMRRAEEGYSEGREIPPK